MEAGDFVKGPENPDDFVRFHIFLVLFCTFWHIKEVFSGRKTLLMPGFCWRSVRIYVLSVCQMHSFSIRGLVQEQAASVVFVLGCLNLFYDLCLQDQKAARANPASSSDS